MCFRPDFGICWEGKGQEGVRKGTVNTASLGAEDIAVWPR